MRPTNTYIFYWCVLLVAGLRRRVHSSSARLRWKSARNPGSWGLGSFLGCHPGQPCGYGSDDDVDVDVESTIQTTADRDYALHDYRSGLSRRDLLGSSSEPQEYPDFAPGSFRDQQFREAEANFHERLQINLFGVDEAGDNDLAWYHDSEEILNDVTRARPLTLGNRLQNNLDGHLRNIAVLQFLQRDLCLINVMREAMPESFWEDFKFTKFTQDPVRTRTLLKNVVWLLSAVGTTSFLWHTLGMPALVDVNASQLHSYHLRLWGAREVTWGVGFAAEHAEDATRYGAFIVDKFDDASVLVQDRILAFVGDRAKQLYAGGGAVITQHWPDTVYDMEFAGAMIVDDMIRLCEMHANARPRMKNTVTELWENTGSTWRTRQANGRTEKLEAASWLLSEEPASSNSTSRQEFQEVTFAVGDRLDTGGVLKRDIDGVIGYFWRGTRPLVIWNLVQRKKVDLLSPYTLFSIVVKRKVVLPPNQEQPGSAPVKRNQRVRWLWKLADGRGWLWVPSPLVDAWGNPRLHGSNGSQEFFERAVPPEVQEMPQEVTAGSLVSTLREINDSGMSTGARIGVYGGLSVAAFVSFHFGLAAVGTGIVVTKSFIAIFDVLVSMGLMNRAEANIAQRTVQASTSLAKFEYLLFHHERSAQSRWIARHANSFPRGIGKLCSITSASREESCTPPMFCLRRGAFFNRKGYSPYGRCMVRHASRTESRTGVAFHGLRVGLQCLLDEDCESDYCHHLLLDEDGNRTTFQTFKIAMFGVCADPCNLGGGCTEISADHKFGYVHDENHISELTRKHEINDEGDWGKGFHLTTMISGQVSRLWASIGSGPGACGPGGFCGGPALTNSVDQHEVTTLPLHVLN